MTIKDGDNEEEKVEEGGDIEISAENPSERREFPNAFYDPTTGKIMRDPVVNVAGDSYDKSTIDGLSRQERDSVYYPNRALKSIIERELELASNSMRASLRRLDEKIKDGWGKMVEQSAFAFEHRPLPPSYYCPITCELMVDPVITPEGYSYERDAIENWINVNGVSPMTRKDLTVSDLRENNALYELIQEEKERSDDSLHPSIRRWKESGTTSRRRVGEEQQHPPSPSAPPAPPSDNAAPGVAATQNYPTTHSEIRARRMRRNRLTTCTLVVVLFTFLVIVGLIPYTLIGVIVAVMIAIGCSSLTRDEN